MLSISLHLDLHYLPTTELFEDEIFHTNITEDVTEEEVTSPQSPPSLHQGREAREPKENDGLPPASFWRTQLDRQREWDRQKKSHQDEVGRRQLQKWADLCELRGEAIWGLTSQTNLQMKFILLPFEENSFLERRWEYLKSVSFPLEEYLQII